MAKNNVQSVSYLVFTLHISQQQQTTNSLSQTENHEYLNSF